MSILGRTFKFPTIAYYLAQNLAGPLVVQAPKVKCNKSNLAFKDPHFMSSMNNMVIKIFITLVNNGSDEEAFGADATGCSQPLHIPWFDWRNFVKSGK